METTRPEAHGMSPRYCYVDKLARGRRRWFIGVSIPLECLDGVLSPDEFGKDHVADRQAVASLLDRLLVGSGMPGAATNEQ